MSVVGGDVAARARSGSLQIVTSGSAVYLGNASSAEQCARLAEGRGLRLFSLYGKGGERELAGQCFGKTGSRYAPTAEKGVVSGWLRERNLVCVVDSASSE